MKTIIVFQKKNKVIDMLEEIFGKKGDVGMVCMADQKVLHETYGKIKNENADLLISVDMAALALRTELDGYSVNQLPIKVIHFMTKRNLLNELALDIRFNLSHLLFVADIEQKQIQEKYPEIPNVMGFDGKCLDGNREYLEQEMQKALEELWLS